MSISIFNHLLQTMSNKLDKILSMINVCIILKYFIESTSILVIDYVTFIKKQLV